MSSAIPSYPPADEPRPLTEQEKVDDWRELVLLEAGYPPDDAIALSRAKIDLHLATDLLARGCAVSTAVEILL